MPHGQIFWTASTGRGWVAWDINKKLSGTLTVVPTHYWFSFNAANWLPRNWVFEASNDYLNWTVLSSHLNDMTFMVPGAHYFAVQASSGVQAEQNSSLSSSTSSSSKMPKIGYRYFRLRQVGPDGEGSQWFGITGFELYGRACGTLGFD